MLQNGINSPIWQGSSPPPNPRNGDIWVEKTSDWGNYWEFWIWNNNWLSQWYYWNLHYNGSSAFQSTFILSPIIPNAGLNIDQWTVNSLVTAAPTTATQWSFSLNALSQSNTATNLLSFNNSGAAANSQQRRDGGVGVRSSNDKILRINCIPGSTPVNVIFTSTLRYQIVRP